MLERRTDEFKIAARYVFCSPKPPKEKYIKQGRDCLSDIKLIYDMTGKEEDCRMTENILTCLECIEDFKGVNALEAIRYTLYRQISERENTLWYAETLRKICELIGTGEPEMKMVNINIFTSAVELFASAGDELRRNTESLSEVFDVALGQLREYMRNMAKDPKNLVDVAFSVKVEEELSAIKDYCVKAEKKR